MLLKGKVAVVTGGTRGIGRAVVDAFAEQGATVVAVGTARRAEGIPPLGPRGGYVPCDVSDEAGVEELFAAVETAVGRVDVLVNNAGIARDAMIHRGSLSDVRRVFDVNLQGTWLCTRAAMRVMRADGRGGAIVNVSSIAAKAGNLGQSAYSASKAAVDALTKTTAREGARYGIRANAIRPGLISTDMTRDLPEQSLADKLASIPLGRPGSPDEVAAAVLFLASDMAGYITGATLDVSGGREM